ncbi:MAG TPA: Nif3-like dinuclear metal center hexameric protein [bacterium]|nr:Nif3-like dinuclear metal center hexameric protein [bacterium]
MKKLVSLHEIQAYLERLAPPTLAEDWDPVGLQVGSRSEEIHGLLVALDATEAALWEAVEHDCNLLVTHHPLFFKALKRLDDSTPASRVARLAAQTGVSILSFHTNLDAADRGLNEDLARKLGLRGLRPLLASRDRRHPKAGLGRLGSVTPTKLKSWLPKAAQALGLANLRYVGDPNHPLRRIAVMTGSGGGFFAEAKAAGADLLVTGDVKYHHALDALAEGIALVDVGHFAGEIGMVPLLARELRTWARRKKHKLPVFESQSGADPFQFWNSQAP